MNDQPPGPGWWQASDGNWYPPETHPNAHPPQPTVSDQTAGGDVPVQYIPPVAPQSFPQPQQYTTPVPLQPQAHQSAPQTGFAPVASPYGAQTVPFAPQQPPHVPQPQHVGYGFGGPPGPTQNVTVNVKRGRGCFTTGFAIIGVLVAIAIVLAAISGGGDGAASGGKGPVTMNIGEPAASGPFEITVVSVQNPYTPKSQFGFDAPPSGKKYVAFEVAVTNTSGDMRVVSTLFGAELSDSLGQNYSEAFTGTDLPALSGEVAPGETRRGWVLFEVPQDATGLQLKLRGGITAQRLVFNT